MLWHFLVHVRGCVQRHLPGREAGGGGEGSACWVVSAEGLACPPMALGSTLPCRTVLPA